MFQMYFATYLFTSTIISWQRLLTIDGYKKIIVDPLATLKNQHISFVESKTRFYTYFVERFADLTKRLVNDLDTNTALDFATNALNNF